MRYTKNPTSIFGGFLWVHGFLRAVCISSLCGQSFLLASYDSMVFDWMMMVVSPFLTLLEVVHHDFHTIVNMSCTFVVMMLLINYYIDNYNRSISGAIIRDVFWCVT